MLEGKKDGFKAFICLLPAMIVLVVFMFIPIIYSILMSFMEDFSWGEDGLLLFFNNNFVSFPSLVGYKSVLLDGLFIKALKNTLVLVVISVPITIALGLLIAVALNSIKKLQGLYQTIFFLPYVTNGIALGMVFNVIFGSNSNSLINAIFGLGNFGWISIRNGANHWTMLVAIVAYTVWNGLAFKILVFMSGLQNIDKQYYDAARIDGTSRVRILSKITIPLLAPQILYISITSFIGAFKSYSSIISIFGSGPYNFGGADGGEWITVVGYIYKKMGYGEVGGYTKASAGAVILLLIILVCTLIQFIVKNNSGSISGRILEKQAIERQEKEAAIIALENKGIYEVELDKNNNGSIVINKPKLSESNEITIRIRKGDK